MTTQSPLAVLEKNGEVASLRLNRPKAFNTIDRDMAVCLRDLALDVSRDADVRVLVITGAGDAFCAGGDIKHFAAHADDIPGCIRALLTPYHEFLETLAHMPQAVVASIHGSVAGAGLSLVSMCDVAIAAESVRFTPAYAKIGLSPDGAGTYGLTRALGLRRASQVFLVEDGFSAAEAQAWGLIARVVAPETLGEATAALVKRLRGMGPAAVEGTKRLLREGLRANLHDHLIDEMETLIRCMDSDTFRVAMAAFIKNR
jgi:enoyl-CoA hydratase/carnithine racemase